MKKNSEINNAYNFNENNFDNFFAAALGKKDKNANEYSNIINNNEANDLSLIKPSLTREHFKKAMFGLCNLTLEISQESQMQFFSEAHNSAKNLQKWNFNCKEIHKQIAFLNPFISTSKMHIGNNDNEFAEKSKAENSYKNLSKNLNVANLNININSSNLNKNQENNFNKNSPNFVTANQDLLNYKSNRHKNKNNFKLDKNQNAFSFFASSNYSAIKKYLERRKAIKLEITKSNVNLSSINTTFVIMKDGLATSQRSKANDYISIGRQQINDDGLRPNDIMLFPTDPSISRSHFKILYKSFFEAETLFMEKLQILLNLLYVKKKQEAGNEGKLIFFI
jgi:hypothetical protein